MMLSGCMRMLTPEEQEELTLSKVRNVGLDIAATMHMQKALESNLEWVCDCGACQYLRASPPVAQAVRKALLKDIQKG